MKGPCGNDMLQFEFLDISTGKIDTMSIGQLKRSRNMNLYVSLLDISTGRIVTMPLDKILRTAKETATSIDIVVAHYRRYTEECIPITRQIDLVSASQISFDSKLIRLTLSSPLLNLGECIDSELITISYSSDMPSKFFLKLLYPIDMARLHINVFSKGTPILSTVTNNPPNGKDIELPLPGTNLNITLCFSGDTHVLSLYFF